MVLFGGFLVALGCVLGAVRAGLHSSLKRIAMSIGAVLLGLSLFLLLVIAVLKIFSVVPSLTVSGSQEEKLLREYLTKKKGVSRHLEQRRSQRQGLYPARRYYIGDTRVADRLGESGPNQDTNAHIYSYADRNSDTDARSHTQIHSDPSASRDAHTHQDVSFRWNAALSSRSFQNTVRSVQRKDRSPAEL